MPRLVSWLFLLLSSFASADRITDMSATERCVYEAKLSVAAYFYFLQGKPRADVTIHWHGDETANEIDFVGRVLDKAYSIAEADRRDHPERRLSEQGFGDRAYKACVEKFGQSRLPPPTVYQRDTNGRSAA
jgi:hypothetical protein